VFLQLKKQWRKIVSLLMSFILVLLLNNWIQAAPQTGTQILWDTYGIPHIYGENSKSLFYAFGWAQMQSHGNLILRLYGQARGQAAEFWGEDYLESDRWVQTMGIPNRAKAWYESQTPIFRNYLDAFVGGMNAYAKEHPEALTEELKVALPLKPVDVLAHAQRVINFTFVVDPERLEDIAENDTPKGSNGWAIAPSHSESGNAMLLANPHLPWSDLYLWYEAQLVGPEINAYGATLVGFPVLTIAFNDNLGWTHTVNTHDGWDAYELPLANDGYRFNGKIRSFDREEKVLKVKEKNGNLRSESLVVRRSVHGPILTEKQGKAIALRVVGLDKPAALQQWWDMARSKNFSEFETALKRLEIPMFTVMYADRQGHIMHLFNGQVPIRKKGDFKYWSGTIPGNTSETLWSKNHPYADLPRVVDPPSGWLQNTNDPPWTTTFPSPIAPDKYPAYMAPRGPMDLRSQRSAKMLLEDEKISFDELMQYKHSTQVELADRLLDDLIPAARQGSAQARRAAEVLATWDRKVDADSRGAVLFAFWKQAMDADRLFAKPWSEDAPLTTPDGLANPAEAVRVLEATATKVEVTYGALDVAWGEVFRLPGEANLPANGADGALGVFRSVWFAPGKDNRFQAVAGDSFVAAIEFSNPVKAMALNSYGNATQPGSPHAGDQSQLFARKELRPVWRSRSEIEAHLSSRQKL
jgi:acyl-homoserine-lactone acylase